MTSRLVRRLAIAAAIALLPPLAIGCADTPSADAREAASLTGGEPARGRDLMRKYGCQTCHVIPGVDGADGMVGPSLAGVASRSYIGGVLANAPDNMIRWVENPRAVDPLTAMPNVGVTHSDARHIAAYLYTLR